MTNIFSEKARKNSSNAVANETGALQGKKMPAVPALQKKDGAEEELPIQKKGGPEEEEPLQMKGGPEEEEPLQMKGGPEEEEPLQMKGGPEEELPVQGKFVVQKKPNNTGLPDTLKSGVENLSGMSMDHVKVHYNSSQPAQLNALAYAQGSDIHVAPGQEKHLPHEAWHVVQQMQGRVRPTMQMKESVPVNDDAGLENEADVMGAKGLSLGQTLQKKEWTGPAINFKMKAPDNDIAQLKLFITGENKNKAITEALIDSTYGKGEPFEAVLKTFATSGTHTFASWEEAKTAAMALVATTSESGGEELPAYEKFGNNFKLPKVQVDSVMRSLGLKPPGNFVATNTLASYAITYIPDEVDYHISWIFDPTGQVAIGVHYAVRDISADARKKEVLYKFYKITCSDEGKLTAEASGNAGEGDPKVMGPLMTTYDVDLENREHLDAALGFLEKHVIKVTPPSASKTSSGKKGGKKA